MGTGKFRHPGIIIFITAFLPLAGAGCLGKSGGENTQTQSDPCVRELPAPSVAGSEGEALVFRVDPIAASGILTLSPRSTRLDEYRSSVPLKHLVGNGILAGDYVNVRNGILCEGNYLAYSPDQKFNFTQSDPRFGEAMAYHYGDAFRASLDQVDSLVPAVSIPIIAHCDREDNAFYYRAIGSGGQVLQYVCLGDSVATPGASYTDDATVTVHELQHATTINSYSLTQGLNQFWYDEAGALNEALSDFLALTFLEPQTPSSVDPRVFSRWALGMFFGRSVAHRGVNRCPTYDSDYPLCRGYGADPTTGGFSAQNGTLSLSYPDGLGWPYPNNYLGPGYLRSAFLMNSAREEIHANAVVMAGALWDAYEAVRANHGGDSEVAHGIVAKVAIEAVRRLPRPNAALRSPVSFREYAAQFVAAAALAGLSSSDQAGISSALAARGLIGAPSLGAGWAQVGAGTPSVPGMRVIDSPATLKDWLDYWVGAPSSVVTQTAADGRASRGDALAVWFDVRDIAPQTAGGVNLKITVTDGSIILLDERYNAGYVDPAHAQIQYAKINGTAIVSALSSANPTFHVPVGNSYFLTNPDFHDSPVTAVWMKVAPFVTPGMQTILKVEVVPSNGPAETLDFPVVFN